MGKDILLDVNQKRWLIKILHFGRELKELHSPAHRPEFFSPGRVDAELAVKVFSGVRVILPFGCRFTLRFGLIKKIS